MSTNRSQKVKIVRNIVDGPSRDAIFDACKYAYDEYAGVSLRFDVSSSCTGESGKSADNSRTKICSIRVSSVEHEDGSGYSLNITGYCNAALEKRSSGAQYKPYRFHACYNAKHRTGVITLRE